MNARRIERWLPVLRPTDGVLISARDLREWIVWSRAAVNRLEDAPALMAWRDSMTPHLATIQTIRPEAANLIRTLISDRLEALAEPSEQVEEPAA